MSLRRLSVLFHLFETVVPLSVHLRAVLKCKAGLAAVVLDQAAPHLTAAGTALLIKNPMCMLREQWVCLTETGLQMALFNT